MLMGFTFAAGRSSMGYKIDEEACIDFGSWRVLLRSLYARIGYARHRGRIAPARWKSPVNRSPRHRYG